MLKFGLDWSYFYWLHASTYVLHTFSWQDYITNRLIQVNGHYSNLTLINIVDFVPFNLAMLPFPNTSCLLPDLKFEFPIIYSDIDFQMTANVTVENLWNPDCENNDKPRIHFNIDCNLISGNPVDFRQCTITNNFFVDNLLTHTFQFRNLIKGKYWFKKYFAHQNNLL